MTDRENHMPRYFAVWSATGVHVGVWEDGKIAADVLAEEYPGGTMRELVDAAALRPEAQGVKVKPLVWSDQTTSECRTSKSGKPEIWADFGYTITLGDMFMVRWMGLPVSGHSKMSDARAAAQAHHEATTLSALDRPEAQDGVAEAAQVLLEAPKPGKAMDAVCAFIEANPQAPAYQVADGAIGAFLRSLVERGR